MNLSGTILRLANGTYVVRRYAPTTYVGGRAQTPTPTVFTIRAIIVPANPRDLQRLPEGERSNDRIRVFTTERLNTADVATSTLSDRVVYRDLEYEVEAVEDYDAAAAFFKITARKVPL